MSYLDNTWHGGKFLGTAFSNSNMWSVGYLVQKQNNIWFVRVININMALKRNKILLQGRFEAIKPNRHSSF